MSSGFITENEIAEARKKRQEEWEKVRKADDPLERPEEPYETKSLYERLQEQKQKRDLEYEETHKLKNMIKGLDDDEIDFLNEVDRTKIAADRKKLLEEEKELNDFRNRVSTLQEKTLEERLRAEISVSKPNNNASTRNSQTKLLKGVVVKKKEPQKRKLSECDTSTENTVSSTDEDSSKKSKINNGDADSINSTDVNIDSTQPNVEVNTGLKCIGILPGLGCYNDSSSDDCSSDSEPDIDIGKDLLGRKLVKKEKQS